LIEHSIGVTDETPCYPAPYKIPEALREQVYDELMQMIRKMSYNLTIRQSIVVLSSLLRSQGVRPVW